MARTEQIAHLIAETTYAQPGMQACHGLSTASHAASGV
jgi:hypothetical protein